ncbi:MAG: FHA domain-containing protein [Planctomycetota bacterium]|nr:FHA domain-containing protein [Planctomycetota bacterium]
MEHRYSLRFESGERRGETIGIPLSGLSVGRKPGNTLQVLDNSVSGSHAVFEVAANGVTLRDTGSTNGTRVGTARVLEQQLTSGDTVLIGNVRFTFRDSQAGSKTASDGIELEGFDEPSPAESALTATTMTPGVDGLARVSAEHLAESKKRSFTGLIAVATLAAIGGGVWYWLNTSKSAGTDSSASVTPISGNLLATGYSFEGEDDAWSNADGTPAAFVRSGPSKRSGAFGIEADLEGGQFAIYRSTAVRATTGKLLAARGHLRTKGDATARIGIEFTNAEAAGEAPVGSAVAWSKAVRGAQDFEALEIEVGVPAGWSQARVVVLARSDSTDAGAGEVDADDVCLVQVAGDAKPTAVVGGTELFVLGDDAMSTQLSRADRVLVSGLCFAAANDASGLSAVAAGARADGSRFVIEPRATAGALILRAEEPLARARVATIGKDGYKTHAGDFERADVATILLGSGADMVRLQLATPAQVRAVAEGGAVRLFAAPGGKVDMQIDFAAERKEAGNIAYAARGAEQRGELGAAITQWQALLNGFPFEDALVTEAETARTRLVQKGLEELRAVEADVERARFFRLADIFKKCRENALALAKRFERSEVEERAQKLAALLTDEIGTLEVDVHQAERARMRGILATLEARGAMTLAGEVRRYLTDNLGDKP